MAGRKILMQICSRDTTRAYSSLKNSCYGSLKNSCYSTLKNNCYSSLKNRCYSSLSCKLTNDAKMTYSCRKYTRSILYKERVVVTGLGIVCPLAVGARRAWARLIAGESSCQALEGEGFSQVSSKVACRVPRGSQEGEFDPDAHFTKSEMDKYSLSMQYGLVAAKAAFADAKWRPVTKREKERTGVAVGMGMVDLGYIGKSYKDLMDGRGKRLSPYFVPRILPNLAPGYISIAHGLMGPSHSCSTACATGSHAIGDAYRIIERGDADAMLAGGVDACVDPLSMLGFSRARALSTKFNSTPSTASRPFDKDRDGFVMGEGAGILVLESLSHARARNATIYCEILGYGLSGDADHITAAREDGEGALLAMRMALKDLPEKSVEQLWYVNAHSTSTPRGDRAELHAISRLVEGKRLKTYVTSCKGSIGHLLGAAGAVESAFAALSIREGIIPPSINIEHLDTEILSPCLQIPQTAVVQEAGQTAIYSEVGGAADAPPPPAIPPRLVLKNSFGFGGTNVSLVFAAVADED